MSLVIRLTRTGKRGERKYRIVVKEKRSKRDGGFIDLLGFYEKRIGGEIVKKVDMKKIEHWKKNGAQITPAVEQIL